MKENASLQGSRLASVEESIKELAVLQDNRLDSVAESIGESVTSLERSLRELMTARKVSVWTEIKVNWDLWPEVVPYGLISLVGFVYLSFLYTIWALAKPTSQPRFNPQPTEPSLFSPLRTPPILIAQQGSVSIPSANQ